jgi:Galactokinase galactose-binding signature/GHMP kinases N terminal domain
MEVKTAPETTIALKLQLGFRQRYGTAARVFRAPGRVNLIGEHTDYNDGFVMPAAIDLSVWAAIAPRDDRRLVVHSENYSESAEIDLDDRDPRPRNQWSDYVQGVAMMLDRAGPSLRGANLLIYGEVSIGSGLSSSAAIEVATGFALLENSGLPVDRVELAKLCRRAENEFVGARRHHGPVYFLLRPCWEGTHAGLPVAELSPAANSRRSATPTLQLLPAQVGQRYGRPPQLIRPHACAPQACRSRARQTA